VKGFVADCLEVINLLQHPEYKHLSGASVLIEDMKFQNVAILWVLTHKCTEPFFVEFGHCVIVSRNYSCTSDTSVDETYFAKVVSFNKQPHCLLDNPILVSNINRALTLWYKVHSIRLCTLPYDAFLRCCKYSIKAAHDCFNEVFTQIVRNLWTKYHHFLKAHSLGTCLFRLLIFVEVVAYEIEVPLLINYLLLI